MLQTGIDLIEVNRVRATLARYGERFLSRVFTENELAYCHGRPQELAARLAAKEAVSKALGVGIQHRDGVRWQEMEIVSDERGKPSVRLAGRAAQRAKEMGLDTFALSLSHTREYAMAVAVAQ
jgi:holo-[acyl-carrier protein] synthase